MAIERAQCALAIQSIERLGGRIAQQHLDPIETIAWCPERVNRVAEYLHSEVLNGAIRVNAIHAVEKRGDLEQPRPVFDEVLVDDLRACQWAARGVGLHGQDAFFAADRMRSASRILIVAMLCRTRSVRTS